MKKLNYIAISLVMLMISSSAAAEDDWFSIFSLFDDDDSKPAAWNVIKTEKYNKIDIGYDVNLVIDPSKKDNLTIKTPDIEAYVKNNTLYIKGECVTTENCNAKHNAYLKDIANVEYIHIKDNAKVYSKKLKKHATPLTVYSEDSSSVELNGMINLKKLQYDSSANSHLLWIDSDSTTINSNKGFVKIAGVTDNVKIRTGYGAIVDATHLRANNSWVSTTDNSVVSIGALKYFYAHSEGSSTIRYPNFVQDTVFIAKGASNIINTKLESSQDRK